MAKLGFNAAEVEPSKAMEPLPNGWYNVQIEASEMKPASTAGNEYLELTMKVLDGDFEGRKVFDRLNIINASEVAQQIAYEQLSAICHATGVINVEDSEELHGKPFMAKVKFKPATEQYEAGNDVKGYQACDGSDSQGATGKPAIGNKQATSGMPEGGPTWAATGNEPDLVEKPTVESDKPATKPKPKPKPKPKKEELAVPATETVYTMIGEASEYTRKEMHTEGWSDEELVAGDMMTITEVAVEVAVEVEEPAKKAMPAKKVMPAKKAAPNGGGEAKSEGKPPWAKG